MGNRGTTPSWDDEEIAKWGFFEHMRMVAAPFRAREAERKRALVSQYIDDALILLGHSTEEDRERLSFAIPHVVSCLQMGDRIAVPNSDQTTWPEVVAAWTYSNWRKRTNQTALPQDFQGLPEEVKQPFFAIVSAITEAWEKQNPPTA